MPEKEGPLICLLVIHAKRNGDLALVLIFLNKIIIILQYPTRDRGIIVNYFISWIATFPVTKLSAL